MTKYNHIVDTYHGIMIVNKNDIYIGKSLMEYGEWERESIEKTLEYARDGLVIDAGANVGTHSLSYAKIAKQVVSFEPIRGNFHNLCGNLALNHVENAQAIHAALGGHVGSCIVPIPNYAAKCNLGGVSIAEVHSRQGELCYMHSIDAYNFDSVSLIKIDVEGSELKVLAGAQKTIARCKPAIYIENDRKANVADLIATLEHFGYSHEWHITRLFNPKNWKGNEKDVFGDVGSHNMLCLKK